MKNLLLLSTLLLLGILISCQETDTRNLTTDIRPKESQNFTAPIKFMVVIVEYRTPKLISDLTPRSERVSIDDMLTHSIFWDSLVAVSAIREFRDNGSETKRNEEVGMFKETVRMGFNDFVFKANIAGVSNPKIRENLKEEGYSQITNARYVIYDTYDEAVEFSNNFSKNSNYTSVSDN